MADNSWQALKANSFLGASSHYLETVYETYLENPDAVEPKWRDYFDGLTGQQSQAEIHHSNVQAYFRELAREHKNNHVDPAERKQGAVVELINAYRRYGHHLAQLDPLALSEHRAIPELKLEHYGLSEVDFNTVFPSSYKAFNQATLKEIYEALQNSYCKSIGVEFMHITNAEETQWLEENFELGQKGWAFTQDEKNTFLQKLTAAEGLEKYLGLRYVGQKRFSLEGGDSLIPMLNDLVQSAGAMGMKEMVLGMAHRGRLNVLVNILGKAPEELFDEFEGKNLDREHSGDVKYHKGFSSDVTTPGGTVHLALSFNPSHLEIINPVVAGSVRARQVRRQDKAREQVMAVLVHGDAAFAGQGVVMETFTMSQARGFCTGGSVHIVINNQIGYTTSNPHDSRSTLYCTDVAKMVQAPIFHVNGDDPEAVLFVTRLALAYRQRFKKDVVIDLICYRRHGHNEGDEPSVTQPMMYQKIRKHPTPRKLYADQLIAENVIDKAHADALMKSYHACLDEGKPVTEVGVSGFDKKYIVDWSQYLNQAWDQDLDTSIAADNVKALAESLAMLPEGFTLQPQLAKVLAQRNDMTSGEREIDWGYAENLAYASLVQQGIPVRLVGQDSRRGTFAHRHAVLHDYNNGSEYTPLNNINTEQAKFTVIDSVLSEEAVLGFEYGYATAAPETLVLWEAQFGDFVNGAQVVIDQFISSGEQKWGRLCGLTMLLPHGYEGQGPEHSSARLERFLQLSAQHNMQVCVPSTPAQAFHMLRRQMLRQYRKPLIVMTPKSLLRHKLATSYLSDLSQGKFHLVIPEIDTDIEASQVQQVVICSGKVYYDLLHARRTAERKDVVLIRVEQLYPFPVPELHALLSQYQAANTVVWCQEEPMNQGAWYCTQHWMRASLADWQQLRYAGRQSSAAPAVGSAKLHQEQQQALVDEALHVEKN